MEKIKGKPLLWIAVAAAAVAFLAAVRPLLVAVSVGLGNDYGHPAPEVLERLALEVPFAVNMSRALQERGIPVHLHVDAAALENEITALLAGGDAR